MTTSVLRPTFLLAVLVCSATLIRAAEDEKAVEIYEPPVLKTMINPLYPRSAQVSGSEGWVELQLMVGTDGKPYEIVVTDSMGAKAFSETAIKAVEQWVYQAAHVNGQPLDAATRMRLNFELDGGEAGVRSLFSRRFQSIKKHIENSERAEALDLLEQIKAENLYEDVFLQIGWYLFNVRWGTPEKQRIALTRASASVPDVSHIPLDLIQMIMLARFGTEIQTNHLGSALNTAEALGRLRDEGKVKMDADRMRSLGETVSTIEAIKKDDSAFSVNGVVGEHANWTYSLLKDEMTFHVLEGELAELKLRCDRRYVGFRFVPDSTFKIPESYGSCLLEVIGNPGTTFTLTQG